MAFYGKHDHKNGQIDLGAIVLTLKWIRNYHNLFFKGIISKHVLSKRAAFSPTGREMKIKTENLEWYFSINLVSPLLASVTLTRKHFNKTLSSVRLTSRFPGFLLSRSWGDVSVDLSWPMSTRRCVQHGDLGHLLLLCTQWRQALLVNLILLSKTKSALLHAILQ